MNEAFDPFNLVILAVAIIIFWRLRSVLGRRTGNERKPFEPYSTQEQAKSEQSNDNVVPLPGNQRADKAAADGPPIWEGVAERGSALAKTLTSISKADPNFAPEDFLAGARMAYEMIVTAFADGDRDTLSSLLSEDVYDGFESAITEREEAGKVVESKFVGIDSAKIIDGSFKGKIANLTVKFVSKLISATKDSEGRIVEGDPTKVREVTDIWTFMRDLSTGDPNWKLVATEAAN